MFVAGGFIAGDTTLPSLLTHDIFCSREETFPPRSGSVAPDCRNCREPGEVPEGPALDFQVAREVPQEHLGDVFHGAHEWSPFPPPAEHGEAEPPDTSTQRGQACVVQPLAASSAEEDEGVAVFLDFEVLKPWLLGDQGRALSDGGEGGIHVCFLSWLSEHAKVEFPRPRSEWGSPGTSS